MRLTSFLSAIVLAFCVNAIAAVSNSNISRADSWSASAMPPPWDDPGLICRPSAMLNNVDRSPETFICDPTGLLSEREIAPLNAKLRRIYDGVRPYSLVDCSKTSRGGKHGFRVAVALVRQMAYDGRTLDGRAQNFANELFQRWGMANSCGAEVLILIALEDQRTYIRTGQVATKYLSESHIDSVFKKMIPNLKRGRVKKALDAGISKIGSYLRRYRGTAGTASPSGNSDTFNWFSFEMWIVLIICAILFVIACLNGVGGTASVKRKKELRVVLRHLSNVRHEYVMASTSSSYSPTTCPFCHGYLTPAWEPTVPTLSSSIEEEEAASLIQNPPGQPNRRLRCGHTFRESCFDRECPTPSEKIPVCPICGDQGGGISVAPPLSETKDKDYIFRLNQLGKRHPEILNESVLEKLKAETPDQWPDPVTESYLKSVSRRSADDSSDSEGDGDGGWWHTLGVTAVIGGVVTAVLAIIGGLFAFGSSFFGGGGGGRSSEYSNIDSDGYSNGYGGGHGAGWGIGNSISNALNGNNSGGGGHGAGWGSALSGAASRFTGGSGFGAGWGDNGGGEGGGSGSGRGF